MSCHLPISRSGPARRGLAPVVLVLLVSSLSACAAPRRAVVPPTETLLIPERVRVRVAGQVTTVSLDEYVLGAALSEVTPLGEAAPVVSRIYDVQAIVARTYAVSQLGRHHAEGFDLCDSTHCQIYEPARIRSSRFAAAARESVTRTTGQVLTFSGRIAQALFHADCGGSTAAAESVWGGRTVPYLRAMTDDLPAETHRPWQVRATTEEVRQILNADSRTSVGRRLDAIDVVARDESGRAAGLDVRGERSYSLRGDLLRAVLNQKLGVRAVQSTRFTITRPKGEFVFAGTGFGHGVGLCQRGAATRARRGETVRDILGTYFPGASLREVGSQRSEVRSKLGRRF